VGNFTAELFSRQGHLGGFFASLHPAFDGLPTARHEAACASGSVAVLAAMRDIAAGAYDVACVAGVEQMRNVSGTDAAEYLGCAAWTGREGEGATYLWPSMFSRLADEYEERFGLDYGHLMAWAKNAFDNGRNNPNAQTRKWSFSDESFTADDEANPVVEGRIRRMDCGQITDGAAAVILASPRVAEAYASRTGQKLDDIPRIMGWGHRTSHMPLEDKLEASRGQRWVFPHLRGTLEDAWRSAGVEGPRGVDCYEVHDCFSITGYSIVDHLGLVDRGEEAFAPIEDGTVLAGGALPLNPSGGLIGAGHPVGATGVRMLLDAAKQVAGRAGDMQVPNAKRAQTLNIGGSATTTVSFVVGR
jgi:acetyl-CoA C-acetyltransferase